MAKAKKCRICGGEFSPFTSTQVACSTFCAIKLAEKQREKVENKKQKAYRAETRRLKEKIKKKSDWADEAQTAFNRFIRARDKLGFINDGKMPECISCGNNNPSIQYAAGHFKTRGGHPELRYEEDNCHLQCNKNCNKEKSGNIAGYRPRLIKKIGIERVEWLEGPHEAKHHTIDDLKEIKVRYNKLARELEKNLDMS